MSSDGACEDRHGCGVFGRDIGMSSSGGRGHHRGGGESDEMRGMAAGERGEAGLIVGKMNGDGGTRGSARGVEDVFRWRGYSGVGRRRWADGVTGLGHGKARSGREGAGLGREWASSDREWPGLEGGGAGFGGWGCRFGRKSGPNAAKSRGVGAESPALWMDIYAA